jgi:hypothetical protein
MVYRAKSRDQPHPNLFNDSFLSAFLYYKIVFFLIMYDIQQCFIRHPSDSTVLDDAGIEPTTVASTALAVIHSYHSARSH